MNGRLTVSLKSHDNCLPYISKWYSYLNSVSMGAAILKSPTGGKTYDDLVNDKTRNMIRKAKKSGFHFSLFWYNDYLKDMYNINTSSPVRQGRVMADSYFQELVPIAEPYRPACNLHIQEYCGVFAKEGHQLVAYCWFARCGEIGIFNRIIGHADFLHFGIMNLLVQGMVDHYSRSGVKYFNYTTMKSASEGLENFKKHTGFKAENLEVVRDRYE